MNKLDLIAVISLVTWSVVEILGTGSIVFRRFRRYFLEEARAGEGASVISRALPRQDSQ